MPFSAIIQRRTPTLFSGRLRQRVDIVKPVQAQDSTGGVDINNNVLVATVWASVEALNGMDKFAAHEFVSEVSHQVTIRYMAGITAANQVHFEGRQFQIISVLNPDERQKMLVLLCVEINDSVQQPIS